MTRINFIRKDVNGKDINKSKEDIGGLMMRRSDLEHSIKLKFRGAALTGMVMTYDIARDYSWISTGVLVVLGAIGTASMCKDVKEWTCVDGELKKLARSK